MVIIPINGKNERMGALFSTPKHLLLVHGEPALEKTLGYMKKFGEISVLAGESYYKDIRVDWLNEDDTVFGVQETTNVIQTVRQHKDLHGDLWIVDCDVVPMKLNKPNGNTVYLFKNTSGLNQYSNYNVENGCITDCNERGRVYDYSGSGVYYFQHAEDFIGYSEGCSSVSQVFKKMLLDYKHVYADTTSDIFRLGTLPDITGGFTDNKVEKTITKTGKTVMSELKWYDAYLDKKDIPKIVSQHTEDYYVDTFTMEFIDREGEFNVFEVLDLVEKYSRYEPLNLLPWSAYVSRIQSHLINNDISGGQKLIARLNGMVLYPTFAHGDLSCINIIPTRTGHRLIDPLYCSNFGNYVLDYAKLLFSLKFYKNDIGNFNLLRDQLDEEGLDVLIASEAVRVATYNKKFNFIAENLIAEL